MISPGHQLTTFFGLIRLDAGSKTAPDRAGGQCLTPSSHPMIDLQSHIVAYDEATVGLAPSAQHFVADLVVLGYLSEVRQNAVAVAHLVEERPPLHALPSARAAFEAVQSLLQVVTAPDIDYAGALAYVYGLKKDNDITEANADWLDGVPPEQGGIGWFPAALEEIGSTWETLAPGKGALIQRAHEELSGRWRRKPDNWEGVSPAVVLPARLERMGFVGTRGDRDAQSLFRSVYQVLNRDTHPRTVVRPIRVSRAPDGSIQTDLEDRDSVAIGYNAAVVAGGSLNLATIAVHILRRMS